MAYYVIVAALHCASDLGDDARLVEVGEIAREQEMWLNDQNPSDPFSAQSAAVRGNHGLWASLGREVETRRRMLEHRCMAQRQYSRAHEDDGADGAADA